MRTYVALLIFFIISIQTYGQLNSNGNGFSTNYESNKKGGPLKKMMSLVIVNTIPSPSSGINDIAYDGENLWVEGWQAYLIYKVDPTDGTILKTIPTTLENPQGLTFDGKNLWISDAESFTIHKVDTANGNVIKSFNTPATPQSIGYSNPEGLAWDGNHLWHNDMETPSGLGLNDSLFVMDTFGDVINSYHALTSKPTGLTFDGQYLWSSDNETDRVYKIDTSNYAIIDSVDAPGGDFPNGLAFDGQYLWVANNDADSIYQIDVGYTSVGFNDVSLLENQIMIYPNPSSNELTIDNKHLEINNISIISATGASIRSIQQNLSTINIADLPQGIYFIQFTIDNRKINKRFIKQ